MFEAFTCRLRGKNRRSRRSWRCFLSSANESKAARILLIKAERRLILVFILTMDFESAMQTFAEAWMAANRTGRQNENQPKEQTEIADEATKETEQEVRKD